MHLFNITVLDLNDNKYYINCYGYEHTIEYIKYVMQMKTNINVSNIQLYMNDIKLIDSKTFADYGINEHSKIRMYFTLKTGFMLR